MSNPPRKPIDRLRITYPCQSPGCGARIDFMPAALPDATLECPRCHARVSFSRDGARDPAGRMTACPVCDCRELFLRKDFPPLIGLSIVVVAGMLSIWFLRQNTAIAYAILLAAAVIDAVLYVLFPRVTVCYRCRAEFRGVPVSDAHAGFDLATQEKYR
jgi:hypothetical protein